MHTITILCPADVGLLDYLTRKNISLPTFCDGNGICGKCKIQVTEGNLPITASDKSFLSEKQLQEGWRLACRAVSAEPVRVRILAEPENLSEAPVHVQEAYRKEHAGHRYGIAFSRQSAALVDLTAVTVVEVVRNAEHPIEILISKYPDVKPEKTISADSDEETALERAIIILFQSKNHE